MYICFYKDKYYWTFNCPLSGLLMEYILWNSLPYRLEIWSWKRVYIGVDRRGQPAAKMLNIKPLTFTINSVADQAFAGWAGFMQTCWEATRGLHHSIDKGYSCSSLLLEELLDSTTSNPLPFSCLPSAPWGEMEGTQKLSPNVVGL